MARLRGITARPHREAALMGLGMAVVYGALQLSVPRVLGAFHDDAVYAALGKALSQGQGYHSIYAAGQPVHLKYPPGLPLLFAILWTVGRTTPIVAWLAGWLSIVATAAAAGLLWWVARARLGLHPWLAFLGAAGPFLLDPTLLYLSLPISEPYFLLGWAGALVLAYRLAERPSIRTAAALGLVVAATMLIRTQAVAVLAGLLAAMALRRRSWRTAAVLLAAAVVPIAVWGWLHGRMAAVGPVSTQPDEAAYLSWIPLGHPTQLPGFVAAALRVTWPAYWHMIPRYLSEVPAFGVALLATFLVLAIAGSVVLGRQHAALALTVAANSGIVLLWPWPQDRFALVMGPMVGLLVAAAIQAAVRHTTAPVRRGVFMTLGLLAASVAARETTFRPFAYLPVNPGAIFGMPYPGHFIAANSRMVTTLSGWLRQHTQPGDRILADAPAAIYLYTGRETVSALPAQSALAPSLFRPPGRYLAGRILADSVTVVVLTEVQHPLARDIAAVFQRCPGVLGYAGTVPWWGAGVRAVIFRVEERAPCLTDLASEER